MAAPVPQTARMTALQNLQQQLPVASQKVASGIQAARDIQLQQAVAKAPTGGAIAPAAQQTAAAATAQTGQAQVEAAKQMVQQAGQVGQLQLGEQQMAAQQKTAQAQQAARQQEIMNVDRLGKLDMKAKQELYDKELEFKKDEAGRTIFNERQLADYAIRNAKSEEEYKSYAQQAQLLARRDLQATETAFNLVMEDLKQKWALAEQRKDQAAKEEIARMKAAAEAAMERKKAKAANSAAMWSSGGMIVGAVAGALIAGPGGYAAGAAVGSQAGAGLGTLAKTGFGQ
jgi:hypothetical protein